MAVAASRRANVNAHVAGRHANLAAHLHTPHRPVIACAARMATDPKQPSPAAGWAGWIEPGSAARRALLALGVYFVAAGVFAAFAGRDRLSEHTSYNHYALLADAWIHHRQDLAHGPPPYAMNNDFAEFEGKTYISFPPFPAVLMVPFVKLAGSPENFRDGQFVIWLAAL